MENSLHFRIIVFNGRRTFVNAVTWVTLNAERRVAYIERDARRRTARLPTEDCP